MKFESYGPKWNKCEFCGMKLELPRKPKIGDRLRHSEKQLDKHDEILRYRIKALRLGYKEFDQKITRQHQGQVY